MRYPPALGPEWWERLRYRVSAHLDLDRDAQINEARYMADTEDEIGPHGKAALYLFGQSFGFRRSDVNAIRSLAIEHRGDKVVNAALDDLADRIEALLPPS